jgi:hypothetical protein
MAAPPGYYESVQSPWQQYMNLLPATVRGAYAPAYADISASVAPQFAAARNYLAANPYAARSGTAAGLNRRILSEAYGSLTGSMGQAAGRGAAGAQDLLGQLLQRRVQAAYERQAQKRSGFQQAAGAAGAIAPYALAPFTGGASVAAAPGVQRMSRSTGVSRYGGAVSTPIF